MNTQPLKAREQLNTQPLTASEARQQLVDTVTARSFVYRFLSKAFEFPNAKGWHWLANPAIHTSFCSAVRKLEMTEAPLRRSAQELVLQLHPGQFEPFREDYLSVFSSAATNYCAMHEAAYATGNPWYMSLPTLFREFGLELSGSAAERHDHLCMELEFMSMLAAKEGYALERCWREQQSLCFEAQKAFVQKHVGRWVPSFCRQLPARLGPGVLASLAGFAQDFMEAECRKFGVKLTAQDLAPHPPAPSLEKFYRGGDSLVQ